MYACIYYNLKNLKRGPICVDEGVQRVQSRALSILKKYLKMYSKGHLFIIKHLLNWIKYKETKGERRRSHAGACVLMSTGTSNVTY